MERILKAKQDKMLKEVDKLSSIKQFDKINNDTLHELFYQLNKINKQLKGDMK
jgi:hypothetical protein